MTSLSSSLQFNVPGGSLESSGTMTMSLKCDTASSGVGFDSAVMPLYSPSYEKPQGEMTLFLEAETQTGLWGHSLHENWPAYQDNWSSFPPNSQAASGFIMADISASVSGERIISKFAYMPMFVNTSEIGTVNANIPLYAKNLEVATGEMTMNSHGHQIAFGDSHLYIKGKERMASGAITMVATGIGHLDSFMPFYISVNPNLSSGV